MYRITCPKPGSIQRDPPMLTAGWVGRPPSASLRPGVKTRAAAMSEQPNAPPSTRKAWHLTQPGDVASLRLIEEPMPQLQPGQVLVECRAWGLNFADCFCALGLYKAAPPGDFVPGLEFAGVVVQVAPATTSSFPIQRPKDTLNTVAPPPPTAAPTDDHHQQQHHTPDSSSSFEPGDRVLGVLRFGAFASHVAIPATYLRRVPPGWSFEEAAAYPVQTLTAAYGLFEAGGFKPGGAVLVHSAAGGVGLQALQILARSNAAVLGLVGSDSKVQQLQQMFGRCCDAAGNSSNSSSGTPMTAVGQQQSDRPYAPLGRGSFMSFAVRVGNKAAVRQQLAVFLQQTHAAGFDVILDSLGAGPYFQASYDALRACGRHVIFGAGALTPQPGLRISFQLWDLLLAPQSLWGVLGLAWNWLWRPRLDVLNMPGDNKAVAGFNLIWLYDRLDLLSSLYDKLEQLHLPAPLVGNVYSFGALPDALEFLQSGQSIGKVVLSQHGQDAVDM